MRTMLPFLLSAALLGACSQGDIQVRGTLADGWPDEPLFVSGEAGAEPLRIEDGAFALPEIPAGPLDLRIGTADREVARLSIRDLAAGASLSMERIRADEERDLAFPSAIRLDGAALVAINGLRMADPEALPERVDEAGAVLSIASSADALLLRPQDTQLPDLRVVVTAETLVTDSSGDTILADELSAGDSVRVVGRTDAGYLYADRITLSGGSDEEAAAPLGSEPASGPPTPVRERDLGGNHREIAEERRENGRETERDRERAHDAERERGSDRGRGEGEERRERQKSKEREKRGEGRGRDERSRRQIPKGHRPPSGECRDWNPNLPPGQQPPPRKC